MSFCLWIRLNRLIINIIAATRAVIITEIIISTVVFMNTPFSGTAVTVVNDVDEVVCTAVVVVNAVVVALIVTGIDVVRVVVWFGTTITLIPNYLSR